MSVRVRPCLSVSVRVAVPCTTPAPASPPCHPFGALPEPRTLNPFHLLRPPSAGRGAEAFVWILPGSHAKITAGFFDDAAFPLPPPAFRLAPLPPLWCLTLAPATPSRLQQGPNIKLCVVPAVRRTWCRGFLLSIGAGLLRENKAAIFRRWRVEADPRWTHVRERSAATRQNEKETLGFRAAPMQKKSSPCPSPPRPASTHPPSPSSPLAPPHPLCYFHHL